MKRFAQVFGIAFLLVGLAGFVPQLAPDGKLFGFFAVDAMHNGVHIATGVLALIASALSEAWMRNYFRVFGIVYALVAIMGIFAGDRAVLGMANNMPDVILHFIAAAAALYCGFARRGGMVPPRGPIPA